MLDPNVVLPLVYDFAPSGIAQRDADWRVVEALVEALRTIRKMPCISELLGEVSKGDVLEDACECASCQAKEALAGLGVEP